MQSLLTPLHAQDCPTDTCLPEPGCQVVPNITIPGQATVETECNFMGICMGSTLTLWSNTDTTAFGFVIPDSLEWDWIPGILSDSCYSDFSTVSPTFTSTLQTVGGSNEQVLEATFTAPGFYLFKLEGMVFNIVDTIPGELVGLDTVPCTSWHYIIIQVFETPDAQAMIDTLYCDNDSIPGNAFTFNLNAISPASGDTGVWSFIAPHTTTVTLTDATDPTTTATIAGNAQGQLVFYWTVSNAAGCYDVDTVRIIIDNEAPVSLYYLDTTICGNTVCFRPGDANYSNSYPGYSTLPYPTWVSNGSNSTEPFYQIEQTSGTGTATFTYNASGNRGFCIEVDSQGVYTFNYIVNGICLLDTVAFTLNFVNNDFNYPTENYAFNNCINSDTVFFVLPIIDPADTVVFTSFTTPNSINSWLGTHPIDTIFFYIDPAEDYEIQYQITDTIGQCNIPTSHINIWHERFPVLDLNTDTVFLPCGIPSYNYAGVFDSIYHWPTNQAPDVLLISQPGGATASVDDYPLITNMNVSGIYTLAISVDGNCDSTLTDTLVFVRNGPPTASAAGSTLVVPCGEDIAYMNANTPVWGEGTWSAILVPQAFDPFSTLEEDDVVEYNSGSTIDGSHDPEAIADNLVFPGTYQFVWTIEPEDLSCGFYSSVVNVIVPDPILDTANAGLDTLVCDTNGVFLQALITGFVESGYWTADSLNPTATTFSNADSTYTEVYGITPGIGPQVYTFYWHLNSACSHATDTVVITYDNEYCCFAYNNPAYQQWHADTTLTYGTVMNGKYYIDGAVTVLDWIDITNADLVFGECGTIIINGGAQIRANNSVFRPCDYNKSWIGVQVKSAASSIIEQCSFKNAQTGIHITSSEGTIRTRISKNTFINNYIGIWLDDAVEFGEGITGNSFSYDTGQDSLFREGGSINHTLPALERPAGIVNNNTYIYGTLSQNDFVATASIYETAVDYTGILQGGEASNSVNSGNAFTNCYLAMECTGGSFFFTSNEIEINDARFLPNGAVLCSGVAFAGINGNSIYSSLDDKDDETTTAIEGQSSSTLVCTGNQIRGYARGIVIKEVLDAFINENRIESCTDYGIWSQDSKSLISCNEINMITNNSKSCTGIHWQLGGPALDLEIEVMDNGIRSNCIYDACKAIEVYATGYDTTDTELYNFIHNNFLYTYRDAGLVSEGIPLYLFKSANTFMSNNNQGTLVADLYAMDQPINSVANYGIQTLNDPMLISVSDQNTMHSTASCSNQISELDTNFLNANETYALYRVCQTYFDTLVDNISINSSLAIRLNDNAVTTLAGMEEEKALQSSIAGLAKLNMNPDKTVLKSSWQQMRNARLWEKANLAELDMNYALLAMDTTLMSAAYSNFSTKNSSEKFLYALQKRKMMQKSSFELNADEKQQLEGIINQQDEQSTKASSMLYSETGKYAPEWSTLYYEPTLIRTDKFKQFTDLIVFPNPAEEEVFLVLNNLKHPIKTLVVFDASGKKVFEKVLQKQGGVERIPIGEFQPGLFLIQAIDTEGKAKHSRIIKK